MSPALSVILFTVSSGAGYGLFAILAITTPLNQLDSRTAFIAGVIALTLITLGLMSSVAHLANPKNAWRAFSRLRTSWLSREGALAIVFYPFALLYLHGLFSDVTTGLLHALLSLAVALIALFTVFATGMIYACLKTIPNWHTPLVPANYIAIALATGGLLFVAIMSVSGHPPTPAQYGVIAILLCTALVLKLIYYFWIGKPQGPTINTATGFHGATVRLLDVGHSAGTFLTDEFGYQLDADLARLLRYSALGLLFVIPILLIVLALISASSAIVALAAVSGLIGTFVERWLFFAEARHAVMLYHGRQRI